MTVFVPEGCKRWKFSWATSAPPHGYGTPVRLFWWRHISGYNHGISQLVNPWLDNFFTKRFQMLTNVDRFLTRSWQMLTSAWATSAPPHGSATASPSPEPAYQSTRQVSVNKSTLVLTDNFLVDCRGTSLIRNIHPPRATMGP